MKKTILFLVALAAAAPQKSYAIQVQDRIEFGVPVGIQFGNTLNNPQDIKTGFRSNTDDLIELQSKGFPLVGPEGTVASLTTGAQHMVTADGSEAQGLAIFNESVNYAGNRWLGKPNHGLIVGGYFSYVKGISCTPLFFSVSTGLYYYGSKSIINANNPTDTMFLAGDSEGMWDQDVLHNGEQTLRGTFRNKLALQVDFALGAAITSNFEISGGVGYVGVQSNLSYPSAQFKAYAPANNLTLMPGYITRDNNQTADQPNLFTSLKKSKNVWQNGVSIHGALTYKVSQNFAIRLKGQISILQAKNHEISYNPSSWVDTEATFKGQTQTGPLNIQNTITQTTLEFVYMMGVGSQPSAA